MLKHEYFRPMLEAHKKSDYLTVEECIKDIFIHLHMHKKNEDFHNIAKKAYNDFELYLERFFFDEKKFVAETKKMAQRHVNHIVGKQII